MGQENNIQPENNTQSSTIQPEQQTNQSQTPEKKEMTLSTIMPTMVDEENDDKSETRQDLSAIIPQSVQTNGEGMQLNSREAQLKSDGCVTLGVVQGEGIAMPEKIELPMQIDIAKRKKEAKDLENSKKKIKTKRDVDKAKKDLKKLNKKTIIALLLLALVVGSFIYIKNEPQVGDFSVINFQIELGESLPIHSSSYAKSLLGGQIDDLTYKVDTTAVVVDQVGEYQFSVTHSGKTKIGIIEVVDTTGPTLETRNVELVEGKEYNPKDFVQDCNDYSGCDYTFEEEKETSYTEPGEYEVHIVAKDAYGNSTVKKAELLIEEKGKVKYYTKTEMLSKYKITTKYEIHFTDVGNNSTIILKATETQTLNYYNQSDFEPDAEEANGEEGCTIDKNKMMIIKTFKITDVGGNTRYDDVIEYLETNGYTLISE